MKIEVFQTQTYLQNLFPNLPTFTDFKIIKHKHIYLKDEEKEKHEDAEDFIIFEIHSNITNKHNHLNLWPIGFHNNKIYIYRPSFQNFSHLFVPNKPCKVTPTSDMTYNTLFISEEISLQTKSTQ